MVDTLPTLKLTPTILRPYGIDGELVAASEIKLVLNIFFGEFQEYYRQLPQSEKDKLKDLKVLNRLDVISLLEAFEPPQLWFDDAPDAPLRTQDADKARDFIAFFDAVIEALSKKEEVVPVAAAVEAETEADGQDIVTEEPTQLPTFTKEEVRQQLTSLAAEKILAAIRTNLQTQAAFLKKIDLVINGFRPQINHYCVLLFQDEGYLLTYLSLFASNTLDDGSQVFLFDPAQSNVDSLLNNLAEGFLTNRAKYINEKAAEILSILNGEPQTKPAVTAPEVVVPTVAPAPQPTEPTTPATSDTPELTPQEKAVFEAKNRTVLRHQIIRDWFGQDDIPGDVPPEFGTNLERLLEKYSYDQIKGKGIRTIGLEIQLSLQIDAQLTTSLNRYYLKQLHRYLGGDSPAIDATVLESVTSFIVLMKDPEAFINSIRSVDQLNQYLYIKIRAEDLDVVKKLLIGLSRVRRFEIVAKGIKVNAWFDNSIEGTGGDTAVIDERHQQLHGGAHAQYIKFFIRAYDDDAVAILNKDAEELLAYKFEEIENQEIALELRRQIFLELWQAYTEEERVAFSEEHGYELSALETTILAGEVPQDLILSEAVSQAEAQRTQQHGPSHPLAKNATQAASKGLGKAGLKALQLAAPELTAALAALEAIGINTQDLEDKAGKVMMIAGAGAGVAIKLLIDMFSHVGTWIGFGLGSLGALVIPGAGLALPFLGAFMGFTAEKALLGKTSAFGNALDSAKGLFGGGGGGGGAGAKGIFGKLGLGGTGGTEFMVKAAAGGGLGTLIGVTVYQTGAAELTAQLDPLNGSLAATSQTRVTGKVCWPVDGVITTNALGFYDNAIGGSKVHKSAAGRIGPNVSMDIGAPLRSTIYASFDGVVKHYSGLRGDGPYGHAGYANYAVLDGADGQAVYLHLALVGMRHPDVPDDGKVAAGDPISFVGMTGMTTGPHLHLDAGRNGPLAAIIPESIVGAVNDQGPNPPKDIGASVVHTKCVDGKAPGSEVPTDDDFAQWCTDAGEPLVYPGGRVNYLPESNGARADAKEKGLCHKPTQLVIHWSGSFSNQATFDALRKKGSACAFAVDSREVWQMQPVYSGAVEEGICSHDNSKSIDIEIAGRCFTNSDAQLANQIAGRQGIDKKYWECLGDDGELEVFPPSPQTTQNAVSLAKWVKEQYNIPCSNIVGHYSIVPSLRADPGPTWLNNQFKRQIGC